MQLVGTRCNDLERLMAMKEQTRCVEFDIMFSKSGNLRIGHPVENADVHLYDPAAFVDFLNIALVNDLVLFVDLKPEGIGKLVAAELLKHMLQHGTWIKEHVIVIARSQENLAAMASANLGLQLGWIFEGALIDPAADAKKIGCNLLIGRSYNWTESFLMKTREAGLRTAVWGVAKMNEVQICREIGVDYVMMRASSFELKEIIDHLAAW